MKTRLFNTLLLFAAFFITCLAIVGGAYFRESITLEPGQIADRRIKASTNVENRIATERNREQARLAAEGMLPLLTLDDGVRHRVADNLNSLFDKLEAIRVLYAEEMADYTAFMEEAERRAAEREAEALRRAEARRLWEQAPENEGLEPPEDEPFFESDIIEPEWGTFESLEMFSAFPLIFTESQQIHLVTMPDEDFLMLCVAIQLVTSVVLEQGVPELDSKTLLAVRDEFNQLAFDSDAFEIDSLEIGYEIVAAHLIPNIVIDVQATMRERDKIAQVYDIVMLQQDQTIVDEGEPVSEEAYAIMRDLGLLGAGLENKFIPILGAFLLTFIIFLFVFLYLFFYHKSMATNRKEAFLLFTLYVMVIAVVWTLGEQPYPYLPLLIFPMLVSVLIETRAALVLSFGLTLISYFIVHGSIEYLLFFLTAGTAISLLSRYTTERAKVFIVGFMVMLTQFALSVAISLIIERNHAVMVWQAIFTTAGFAALNGMLTVIVCMGSLPFWEVFFGVVTPVKLLDLTNPTNPLLRRLTIEAPGTYHHALIVANLAETAAYDIGANPHTARAGGYYHDIGKLKYPQYFAENLAGENPHDNLDPYNSAQIIVSHVEYGLILANQYKLPFFIRDVIKEHHGTSLIPYFYAKAKSGCEQEDVDEKEFRYPYTIPQTKESACVMLADVVEATVRSMIPRVKSVNEVEDKIKELIRNKLADGQLADSQLSIKDVATIEKSFFHVLKGMYHERIVYPKLDPPKDKK
jgi:hypothetical protein